MRTKRTMSKSLMKILLIKMLKSLILSKM